jgi:hypothetical protein
LVSSMGIILRFVHNPTGPWLSRLLVRLILFQMRSPTGYSHVEAVTPDGFYLGAHATGVEKRRMDYDAGAVGLREKFVLLTVTADQAAKFYHYLNSAEVLGERYGFWAILGFVFRFNINKAHTVVCSALMTLALRWCLFFPYRLPVFAHKIAVEDLDLMLDRPDVRPIEKTDPIFKAHIAGT